MKRLVVILAGVLLAVAPGRALAAWTEPVTVPASKNAAVSRVGLAADGTVAVGFGAAQVAIRRPSGRWEATRTVASPRTTATAPDVAFDARGNLLVTWTQSPARPGQPFVGPYTIRVRTWTAAHGWGGVRVLGRSGHFLLAQPRIAVNARGDAIVSWRGFRRAGRRVVEALASSLRIAGGRFGPERDAAAGGPYRDVALDLRGNAYGVYTTYAGPRNHFVYQSRGHGWQKPERLPGTPASKPRIAVAGDRLAVIAWRAAAVDSEGEGIQSGLPWAIMRPALGGYTAPAQLSTVATTEVGVAGPCIALTWAAPDFLEPAPPGALDLHWAIRIEGNAISPEQTVPGARYGPSACLADGSWLIVYGIDNAVGSARWSPRTATTTTEPVASRGYNPSVTASGRGAAAAWFDPDRNRLRIALFGT